MGSMQQDHRGLAPGQIHQVLINNHLLPRITLPKLYKPKTPDLEKLQPYLGWSPKPIILKTLENTTQVARHVRVDDVLKKHFKTRWAALNVPRRNEEVASDSVFADVKAVDDGSSCASSL